MGEVGAAIPDNQSESPSANGEVNGVCKASEPVDVDTEEDSQISSENGISDESGENCPTKNIAVSKADTPDSPQEEDTTSKPSGDGELSTHSENSNENSQKSNSSIINKDEIKENGIPTPSGEEDCPEQEETDETSTDSENTCDSQKPEDKPTDEVLVNGQLNSSPSPIPPPPTPPPSQPIADKQPETKISDEIEIIESDDESKDDEKPAAAPSSPAKDKPITVNVDDKEDKPIEIKCLPALEKSDIKSTGMLQEKCEPMEVDSTTNGNTSVTITKPKPVETSITNDDNLPVVIQSDSEGEYDDGSNKKHNDSVTNGQRNSIQIKNELNNSIVNMSSNTIDDEIHEILSDKDDCVVIEDDDKKETSSAARKNNRQRKSVVKVRDFSAFGDDDIQEIVEDLPTEQPPAKRFKTSLDGIQGSPMPQIGQITIKDARTLMGPFVDSSGKQTFQQQFIQASGGKGSKEPTLVIIETNSMLKNPQTPVSAQNVQKQNSPFPMLPAGISAQGVFPVNIRPGLSPLSTNQTKMGNNIMPQNLIQATTGPSIPISNPTLLPALTDDMFVLEAPSFIVPYIYEKPPSENLKEIVTKMSNELEKIKKEKLEIKKTEQTENITKIKSEGGGVDDTNSSSKDATKKSDEKRKKKKKDKNPDDSWDESDTSTDEEASDAENRTKVLIKEVKDDLDTIKTHIIAPDVVNKQVTSTPTTPAEADKKTDNYFESPLGKFFIDIGVSLVQEFVQNDLLRQQKRKRDRAGGAGVASAEIQIAINSLKSNLEDSRKRNEPFKFEMKRCEYCNFKSESALAMAHHYETPHMRQYLYKCNFCSFETRPPYDILFHMEACHNIKGRLEKAPSYHQCPNCPFEDNGKSKLARHVPVCMKKFRPEGNLLPPHDWEAPAKIPRIKPRHGLVGTATAYQAMAAQAAAQKAALASLSARGSPATNNSALMRSRGRPQTVTRPAPGGGTMLRNNQPMRPQMPGMVLPNNYQISGGQLIQVAGSSLAILPNSHSSLTFQPQQQNAKKNSGQQPSISITPLPRQPGAITPMNASPVQAATLPIQAKPTGLKPGQNQSGGKASFVICEICDGYIKDLEQLRNHMQWMHKVKIHPKMIYNRPPLNCQKCQFRFFTDQGLERHLLGSHGLVTSSMQEAANKGRDAGRCPVCGRMYQWKLLNHVSRDHHMTLKPAHLSYKCTVCTATFGMYKQFENHVYTAHSTVAKKAMDAKKGGTPGGASSGVGGTGGINSNIGMGNSNNTASGSTNKNLGVSALTGGDSLLKPLKINDEITIIPQPATKSRGSLVNEYESHVID